MAPVTRPTTVGNSAGSSRTVDSSDFPTLTAASRRTLLANTSHSSSVTTSPVATPRMAATAGPPARLMPMGTHSSTRKSVPCRMPQAMEPNIHSPRNRNVPMATSSIATTTNEMAARTRPAMTPRSCPETASSALSRSACAWARPRALDRTRPMDSATPGASSPLAAVPAAPGAPVEAPDRVGRYREMGFRGRRSAGTSARIGGRWPRLPFPDVRDRVAARMRIAGRSRSGHLRRTDRARTPSSGRPVTMPAVMPTTSIAMPRPATTADCVMSVAVSPSSVASMDASTSDLGPNSRPAMSGAPEAASMHRAPTSTRHRPSHAMACSRARARSSTSRAAATHRVGNSQRSASDCSTRATASSPSAGSRVEGACPDRSARPGPGIRSGVRVQPLVDGGDDGVQVEHDARIGSRRRGVARDDVQDRTMETLESVLLDGDHARVSQDGVDGVAQRHLDVVPRRVTSTVQGRAGPPSGRVPTGRHQVRQAHRETLGEE